MTPVSRDPLPDLLRAFALIGIVLVNVELFAYGLNGYSTSARETPLDMGLTVAVFGLFTMKSYSLFSMMFGAGLGYQLASARTAAGDEGAGRLFSGRYFRRMLGLFVLGLAHAIFLFSGDILVTYAVFGCLLFLFRNAGVKTLIFWGLCFIAFQALILFSLTAFFFGLESLPEGAMRTAMYAAIDEETARLAAAGDVFRDGSFWQIALARLSIYPVLLQSVPMTQGISALGFFLLGLAGQKRGWFTRSDLPLWKLSRYVFLPLGLLIALPAGWLFAQQPGHNTSGALLSIFLNMVASPLATFGFVGWLVKLSDFAHWPVLSFIARGGSASLSAYLLQSVLMCLVFLPFGLGLFGEIPVSQALLFAFGAGILSICFTSLWLKIFKRGPAEILLRRWTYLGETRA